MTGNMSTAMATTVGRERHVVQNALRSLLLTNYISQLFIGILLFYGLDFALGTQFGLIHIELTALIMFLVQIVLSLLWLRYFRFGP